MAMELRLNSPVGAEPMTYTWPLSSGTGRVRILLYENTILNIK